MTLQIKRSKWLRGSTDKIINVMLDENGCGCATGLIMHEAGVGKQYLQDASLPSVVVARIRNEEQTDTVQTAIDLLPEAVRSFVDQWDTDTFGIVPTTTSEANYIINLNDNAKLDDATREQQIIQFVASNPRLNFEVEFVD